MQTMADAFHHTLKDVYYAEQAITKAMPRMIDAAGDGDLKVALQDHLQETKTQLDLLQEVFASIGEEASGEKCDAIEGLIKETEGILDEASGQARSACLIGAAQAVEHYEIARYGTLRQWAKELKND